MRWLWCLADVLLVVSYAGCGGSSPAKDKEDEKKGAGGEAHVSVRVEPARLAPVRETVDGLGRCEALPDHLATLTPAVEGHVHDLLVQEGYPVKKGQVIVELDQVVARADVAEKTAARDGLKAALTLLKSLPRAEERLPNELAVAQAKLATAQAQATLARLQPLRERREVSEQQLYDAQMLLEQARLKQQAAEATLQVTLIGPRPEAVAEAQSKIQTAEAALDLTQAHLGYHTIRAPIDGVLDSLTCHPGQTIAIGAVIGEVVDTRQVFASLWLAPRPAQRVRTGLDALVTAGNLVGEESESDDPHEDKPLAGKVAFVGRVADPQTGNLPVHILVDNPDGTLTIGQSVRVAIIVSETPGVLQVPAAAVNDLGEGPILQVVRDGKAALLHPKVGTRQEGWVAITDCDLKPGEPVIVDGGYNLPDGTPVQVGAAEDDDEKDQGHDKKDADSKDADSKNEKATTAEPVPQAKKAEAR